MIYVFSPYYDEDTPEFSDSILNQTAKFRLIRRNRKRDKIHWTKACNDFWKEIQTYRGIKDDDVICILNNDISFSRNLFEYGNKVKIGEVGIPFGSGIRIDWRNKQFYASDKVDCFPGRCFFITYKDFVDSKGFSKLLPHYLADYEFAIRMIRKGLKPWTIPLTITHKSHRKETKPFKIMSVNNPFFWTIFLLKAGRNRYLPLNILKAWITAFR